MTAKPKALGICFFPAFTPPSSGGEMRLGQFYREFSETHDVTLLTSTDFGARYEEITHKPGLVEIRFPKDEHWRRSWAALEALGVSGDLAGLAFLLAVSDPECKLRRKALELAKDAAVVIHDFAYSEPIFADSTGVFEVYNSNNVEASLLSSVVRGPGFEDALLRLLRAEGNLARRAARVFATSPADAETFRLLYGVNRSAIGVCPNGFSRQELEPVAKLRAVSRYPMGSRPNILFTASGHHPNVEAAEFMLKLANEMPECDFLLAGGVCGAFAGRALPVNLRSFGPFTPEQKSALLAAADIYLNPVVLGSGTSLKALESMGAGVPTVATPQGVRGLGLVADVHAKIVERAEMAAAIRELLGDRKQTADMALQARQYALAHFTWARIVEDFTQALQTKPPPAGQERGFVLAFNDYPVLTAQSGGEVRVRKLHESLQSDLVLVSFGPETRIVLLDSGVLHLTIAKTPEHLALESRLNENQIVSVNDVVAALCVASNRALKEIVAMLAARAGALVFEHPYMAPMLDVARAIRPDLPVVYSAHNVEATLKNGMLIKHPLRLKLVSFVEALENRLVEQSQLVVCCSEADAAWFSARHARVIVVANGCSIPLQRKPKPAKAASRRRVGFLGSSHTPNAVAARYIVGKIAPAFPEVRFEFVGGACDAIQDTRAENVVRHGVLADAEKSQVLHGWDVALNPVESGGGSSLKLPDFLAHELPTLNTPVGARGFDIEARKAGRIAPLAEFASALRQMLEDERQLRAIGDNAYRYAEEALAWPAVTAHYRDELSRLISPPTRRRKTRLLVVTYRYTEPPLGGAEEYLIEVLKRLRPRFDTVDLAAVDVQNITNRHHFGCDLKPAAGAAARVGALFDHSFYFKCEEPPESELIGRCRELERIWAHEDFDLFRPFVDDLAKAGQLRLLCGFFSLEVHDGVMRRWTAPRFSFLLPANATVFRMSGWGAIEKKLTMRLIDVAADGAIRRTSTLERRIGSAVDVNLALPPAPANGHRVLEVEVDEHTAPGDHRPFGILLESAHALAAREPAGAESLSPLVYFPANFAEDIPEKLRVSHTEAWVEALRDAALRRSAEADAHFAASRGPHSPAMQAWLADNAHRYDAVLVQGVPFDVIPRTVRTLSQLPNRPRVVTLPHFHGDDRFYHWRAYFEAFEAADATLLFSGFLAERLGARDKFAVVPGGGVRVEEIADIRAREAFAAIHPSDKPFFLVLGRKTGSKGYPTALAAFRQLRRKRPDVELVMIGPDDDGVEIRAEGVSYLGRQPREAIRGALASCLALVTMSQSESFGIVLCEAWLFGKPVIANANCYSFRDLVRPGETGLLAGSEAELLQHMETLVADPALRVGMGRAGFKQVVERYSWEVVAEAVGKSLTNAA